MPVPFTDPPFDPDHAPYDGDERQVVTWLLDHHRRVFLRNLDGITEAQARRTIAASDLTLIGLARHMGFVEQHWFGNVFLGSVGSGEDWHYDDSTDPDRFPSVGARHAGRRGRDPARGDRARTCAHCDTGFDVVAAKSREGRPVNLRWILVHLVEEYARHCGHADLIRQAIDGSVGD